MVMKSHLALTLLLAGACAVGCESRVEREAKALEQANREVAKQRAEAANEIGKVQEDVDAAKQKLEKERAEGAAEVDQAIAEGQDDINQARQ